MIYRIAIIVFFCLVCKMCSSQSPYYFCNDIDTLGENSYIKSLYKSFTGKINRSPVKFELPLEIKRYHDLNRIDSSYYLKFKKYNAYEEIIGLADKYSMTCINEDHFNSFHRLFTTILLDSLYKLGYKYLFIEGLKNSEYCDSLANKSYIPIDGCGVYIKDPYYANLIRRAVDIGYSVLSYESTNRDSIRDKEMAKNILNKSSLNDSAKILIHCGFAHNIENQGHRSFNHGKTRWLAYYLKKLLNIDVLSIILTELNDYKKYNNPYYDLIQSSDVIVLKNRIEYFSPNVYYYSDLFVYFPPSLDTLNLSDKDLININLADFLDLQKNILEYPIMVFIYEASQTRKEVPVFVKEIIDEDDYLNTFTPICIDKQYKFRILMKNGSMMNGEIDNY